MPDRLLLQNGAAPDAFAPDEAAVADEKPATFDAALAFDDPGAATIVTSILGRAIELGASDLHFICKNDTLLVRARIDGALHQLDHLPPALAKGFIRRLKVLAHVDIAEQRKPQDGRFALRSKTDERHYDARLATFPAIAGEGAVVRLLERSKVAPTLTHIGLTNAMQMGLERIVSLPHGTLVVTGPTGSGKSTTLFAALSDIARPDVNVITVEDPVEYELPGTYQLQVNVAAGMTFANVLRSVLRGDPDVIVVGEIRDTETALLAASAAITGHLVLTTLHTNDAVGALTRLVDMGVEPYRVSAALTAVLSQRLVRRLCEHCRQPYEPSADHVTAIGAPAGRTINAFRAVGCDQCSAGYRGRVGVFELLVLTAELRELIARGAPRAELEPAARRAGAEPIWVDGLVKAEAGTTSLEELKRVLG